MYCEQLSRDQLENFYKQNPIICQNQDGSEFQMKYKLCVDGKYYNFDGEKYGYVMFLKDFTISIPWLHGPVKQEFIKRWQNYQKDLFIGYEDSLNDYLQAKAFKQEMKNEL